MSTSTLKDCLVPNASALGTHLLDEAHKHLAAGNIDQASELLKEAAEADEALTNLAPINHES